MEPVSRVEAIELLSRQRRRRRTGLIAAFSSPVFVSAVLGMAEGAMGHAIPGKAGWERAGVVTVLSIGILALIFLPGRVRLPCCAVCGQQLDLRRVGTALTVGRCFNCGKDPFVQRSENVV